MEMEKRKRENEGEANGKKGELSEDAGGHKRLSPPPLPADEEVEEFFAILKRIRVAVKYFQRRDDVSCVDCQLTAKCSWSPSFEQGDFDGQRSDSECSREHEKRGLDLNSDPSSDVSGSV